MICTCIEVEKKIATEISGCVDAMDLTDATGDCHPGGYEPLLRWFFFICCPVRKVIHNFAPNAPFAGVSFHFDPLPHFTLWLRLMSTLEDNCFDMKITEITEITQNILPLSTMDVLNRIKILTENTQFRLFALHVRHARTADHV